MGRGGFVSVEEDLVAILLADANVTFYIGSRVYLGLLPPNVTLAAVSYNLISRVPVITHGGDPRIDRCRIQLDIWTDKRVDSVAIAETIRQALSGIRGGVTYPNVDGCRLIGERPIFEIEPRIWRTSQEYEVLYVV